MSMIEQHGRYSEPEVLVLHLAKNPFSIPYPAFTSDELVCGHWHDILRCRSYRGFPMLLSPEVDAIKARMMAVLVKDSEGFFDDPHEAESLGITVRIACEFFIFLQESSGVPKFDEADYIAGTIRSGMDWFYSMAQTGRILTGLKLQNSFGPKLPSAFAELKLSYGSVFQ